MSADEGKTVRIGADDSILSIAKENGFFWRTIWNHGRNSQLKSLRKEPEVLQQGDEVYVPKLETKTAGKPSDAKHKFMLRGEQAKFKMQLRRLGQPRAGEAFIMNVDGELTSGVTDGDGWIKCDIPNDASGGEISLQEGKEIIPFSIGRLDPEDSPSGVRQRLSNVGFPDQEGGGEKEMPAGALKKFQAKHKLEETGKFDGPTQAKLKELHPS